MARESGSINRRDFIRMSGALIGAASMTSCMTATGTVESGKRPNILFIFSDDHAIRAISAYGAAINKTPNIDRIAKEGALFRKNYCGNSICAPSRAAVLTGKHAHINGVTEWQNFDGSQFTFPKALQSAGYKTAIFGKWHLKSDPTGFDEWMVYPGQGDYYNPRYLTKDGNKQIEGYSTDINTDLSIDFLKRNSNSDKPLLLMCHFKAPHRNWLPGPKHLGMYKDVTFPEPDSLFDDYSTRNSNLKEQEMEIDRHMLLEDDLKVPCGNSPGVARMTDEQKKTWHAAYDAENEAFQKANLKGKDLVRWKYQRYMKDYLSCIASVDDNIGRILDYLKESGLEKNTLVVYSSDQGFYTGEHGWFDKRWMYEESFRMPLMMRWPGVIRPGTEITQLTQNIDFAPTFLAAAGVEVPKGVQGESMMPLIVAGKDCKWRESLYYHYYNRESGHHMVAKHCGVKTNRYKLINYYVSGEWELFDLEKDPGEMKNIYADPANAVLVRDLKNELVRLRKLYKDTTGPKDY